MKKIYLNEYNILMSDRTYLPASSGMLRAYAESNSEIRKYYEFFPFLFIRDRPEKLVQNYQDPCVAGFSSSMWNHQLNLKVARMVKTKFKDCVVVFGGPHVPNQPETFLRDNPFIDVVVHGEGEITFTELLLTLKHTRNFENVQGVSYREIGTNRIVSTPPRPLVKDLNDLPSPYLNGLYGYLIGASDIQYQVIFESSRGCPFSCSYCYWGMNNKGGIRRFDLNRLKAEIEWMGDHKIEYVFGADSNFGMHQRDYEVSELFADCKKRMEYPKTFRVCYGKDNIENNFKVAKLLNDHGLTKGVTLSRQSNSPVVLENIKRRNIGMGIFEELQKKYHAANINVYSEFILGLPGETYISFKNGIEETLQAGLHDQINIFYCEALPNTDITDPDYMATHGIQIRKVELAEFHATRRRDGEVKEFDEIVIGTNSMSVSDWKKTAILAWGIQLFYGLKLGFFLSSYLHNEFGIRYTDVIEFTIKQAQNRNNFQLIGNELVYCEKFLENLIERGGSQCIFLDEFGDISWAIDEVTYLRISKKIDEFYVELFNMTITLLEQNRIVYERSILQEIFAYQKIRVPNYRPIHSTQAQFEYNIPEYFDMFLKDEKIPIVNTRQKLILDNPLEFNNDKQAFAKQIVWFNRKDKGIIHQVQWNAG